MKRDIKKEILVTMLKSEQLKYGDIHPEGVDNDLFNYHLQHLVKLGLVDKKDSLYSLSSLGKYEVAEQNPLSPSGKNADRFKLNVLTVVLREGKNGREILLQKRKRHPFYDSVSVMGGTLRKGELVTEAAKRKLFVETGLTADFTLCGLMRQVNLDAQRIFVMEDILFHICCTDQYSGELIPMTEYGENYWAGLNDAIHEDKKHAGSLHTLVNFLDSLQTTNFREIPLFYWETKDTTPKQF